MRLKYGKSEVGNVSRLANPSAGYSEAHNFPLPDKCQLPSDLSELNSFIFIGDEYVKNRPKSPVLRQS